LVSSLAFLNKNLLGMLLISEFSLVIMFLIGIAMGAFLNVYYVLLFSFFLLVLGGLELALNMLLLLL
jgi:hypothetical protein